MMKQFLSPLHFRRIFFLLFSWGLGVVVVQSSTQTSGSFSTTGSLGTARSGTKAALLQNGKVLVPGGFSGSASAPVHLASCEIYDPGTGSWSSTGNLVEARNRHTVTLLSNGKVLVTGGRNSSGPRIVSAELYDPATGTWTLTGSLLTGRAFHAATLLQSGKVLVSGSQLASNGEVYDPATGNWSATGNHVTARYFHTATLLQSGKVLVAGGVDNSLVASTASAELYDPATGNWSATGNLATARDRHTATLLPSGKVLVAGGYSGNVSVGSAVASAELYDPATGSWSATGNLASARDLHTATLLQSGQVLVAGGLDSTALASAELYDPTTGSWSATGSLATARYFHAVTLLQSGQVLMAGGTDSSGNSLASAELYHVSLQLTTAVSRKTHTGVGAFDINMPLTVTTGVECRAAGAGNTHTLVFTFNNNVVSGNASVTAGTGSVAGSPTFSGNAMTVNLTGVANAQKVTVTLSNVTDSFSQVLPSTGVTVGFLIGDTTGDGTVNSGDIAQTKSQSGQTVTVSNFREDVTLDGSLNSGDIALVKSKSGTGFPVGPTTSTKSSLEPKRLAPATRDRTVNE